MTVIQKARQAMHADENNAAYWYAYLMGAKDQYSEDHTEVNVFTKEELHENCTVQVLINEETGATSIGWWANDKE